MNKQLIHVCPCGAIGSLAKDWTQLLEDTITLHCDFCGCHQQHRVTYATVDDPPPKKEPCTLSPEDKVWAIAQAMGWQHSDSDQWVWRKPNGRMWNGDLPAYLEDLNAMHQVIMSLSLEDQCEMIEYLRREILKFKAPSITATAAQLAEAFLNFTRVTPNKQ